MARGKAKDPKIGDNQRIELTDEHRRSLMEASSLFRSVATELDVAEAALTVDDEFDEALD